MEQLAEALQQLPVELWSAAVHLGAGHGAALPAWTRLRAERLVLVEGDPDARDRLSHRSDLPSAARIRAAVLGAQSGQTLWHRYSLAMLNGPLDAAAWSQIYPRLRLLSSVPVDVQPVSTELAQALEGLESDGANLQVLDLPGQEDDLLAAVPGDLLRRYEWIVVRGCASPPGPEWSPAAAAVERLTSMGYAVQPTTLVADPLWSVATLRLDAAALRLYQLGQQVQQLEQDGHQLRAELDAARARAAGLETELAQSRAESGHRAAERDALAQALTGMAAERDKQLGLVRERQERVDALQGDVARLTAKSADAASGRDALVGERDALVRERTVITAAHDEQARLAAERQSRLKDRDQEIARLGTERDELKKTLATTREEHGQRDGAHLKRIEALQQEIVLLKASCDELQRARDTLVGERDALAKARTELTSASDEQARLATERQQRLEALEKEHTQLTAERNALDKERTEEAAARTQLSSQVAALKSQLDEEKQARVRDKAATLEVQTQLDAVKKASAEFDSARTAWKRELADLNIQLRDARRALSVAVRSQALRENDLRELQGRYAQLLQEQEASQSLMTKLSDRLMAAQQYFQQLATPMASGKPVEVSTGRRSRRSPGQDAQAATPEAIAAQTPRPRRSKPSRGKAAVADEPPA